MWRGRSSGRALEGGAEGIGQREAKIPLLALDFAVSSRGRGKMANNGTQLSPLCDFSPLRSASGNLLEKGYVFNTGGLGY